MKYLTVIKNNYYKSLFHVLTILLIKIFSWAERKSTYFYIK